MRPSLLPSCMAIAALAVFSTSCRTSEIDAYLRRYPDTAPEVVNGLKSGIVVCGMTPMEAQAAGGAGLYDVVADEKWPVNTNPMKVMAAQKEHPDESRISLSFRNKRQFSTKEAVSFTAYVERGRVARIERNSQVETTIPHHGTNL